MEEKNYNSLDRYYKKRFGKKVFKVCLDAGFSCPNKDGTKGTGGCIFCNGSAGVGDGRMSLKEQFDTIRDVLKKKWPNAGYIVFLEANTNTYGPFEKLKEIYEDVLDFEGVLGLSIATRCDSIDEYVYDYLEELSKRIYLSIELGLQSSFNESLDFLNRGHTKEEFGDCVENLRKRGIEVVVHLINGIPGESKSMMIENVRFINELDVQGVKFHMLYIEKGTRLAKMYEEKPFRLLTDIEYIDILASQIEVLDEGIVVHRLLSGPDNGKLLAPKWLFGKFKNLNAIERYFKDKGVIQGNKK